MKTRLSSRSTITFFVLLFLCSGFAAADTAAHPELLVSSDWLASHLNDSKVVVLQVGHDRSDYEKEHIPGARFLSSNDFTTGHQGLMVELPPVEKLVDWEKVRAANLRFVVDPMHGSARGLLATIMRRRGS